MLHTYNYGRDYNTNKLHISANNLRRKPPKSIKHLITATQQPAEKNYLPASKSHKFNKHNAVFITNAKPSLPSSSSALSASSSYANRDVLVVVADNKSYSYNCNNSNNNRNTRTNNECNIAYVSNLLKRVKRLAQPRILRVKSSHAGGMGSGYNRRNKEFRFGKCLTIIMDFKN